MIHNYKETLGQHITTKNTIECKINMTESSGQIRIIHD